MMAAKASEDPAKLQGQVETIRAHVHRQLPRSRHRDGEGPGDARLARRPVQHEGEAAGELRPRADGAVQHGRRLLHRVRRLRGRARLHGLEPAGARRRRARTTPRRTSSSTTPASHETAAKTFIVPDLPRRQPHDPGAIGRRRACRTAIDLITAVVSHPADGAAARRRRLWNYFVSEINPPPDDVRRRARADATWRTTTTSAP